MHDVESYDYGHGHRGYDDDRGSRSGGGGYSEGRYVRKYSPIDRDRSRSRSRDRNRRPKHGGSRFGNSNPNFRRDAPSSTRRHHYPSPDRHGGGRRGSKHDRKRFRPEERVAYKAGAKITLPPRNPKLDKQKIFYEELSAYIESDLDEGDDELYHEIKGSMGFTEFHSSKLYTKIGPYLFKRNVDFPDFEI